MIKRIKDWFRTREVEFDILNKKLDLLNISRTSSSSMLMRHLLGSIDLSDVNLDELEPDERKKYCATISAVFPTLEKDIKKFLYEQLMFQALEAKTWEEVLVGRGTFNGMDLLLEHWKKAHEEHIGNSLPKEKFDKYKVVGEL